MAMKKLFTKNTTGKKMKKKTRKNQMHIADMLTYRRAHDSQGEREFIARYIAPVAHPVADANGAVMAYALKIGQSRYCFSAHTDSVHNRQNDSARQPVAFDAHLREYIVGDASQRDCLGADNAAGCYVLLKMIGARVPGLYVFFRGEERGGIGSSWIAENARDLFSGIDAAIAFDRKGTSSIITEMACGKTCSDAFANSLGDALGLGHAPDPTGSFTDTANLAEFIAECTNVSCGYANEHSSAESLDAEYLERLADACIATFSSDCELVIEREPGDFNSREWSQWQEPDYCDLESMTDEEIKALVHWGSENDLIATLRDARDRLRHYQSWDEWGEDASSLPALS
jgi:hypothetical protein